MRRCGRGLLWLVLAIPAAIMLSRLLGPSAMPMDLLHPTGEMALRLMVLAMLPGPLLDFFGPNRFLRSWLAIRRNLGVAAFAYGALHLLFYGLDMGSIGAILAEFSLPAIWTGWIAFAFMLAMASISREAAMSKLGRWWKPIQRTAYPAVFLALAHWVLLDREWGPALVHLAPLLIVWSLRGLAVSVTFRQARKESAS